MQNSNKITGKQSLNTGETSETIFIKKILSLWLTEIKITKLSL